MKRTLLLAAAYLLRSANADCAVYTVQAGDTCVSIGRSTNATYAQLLAWNSEINIQCSNLGSLTGSELCVSNPLGNYAIPTNTLGSPEIVTTVAPAPSPTPDDTNSNCGEYYLVVAGDDCGTVTAQFQITLDDFIFLNPQVWDNCTNLMRDYYYCVRPVGYITTYPGYGGSATTEPFVQTPSTPVPENPLANYSSSQPVIPIANKTRLDCYDYITFDNITENEAANCWNLAGIVGVSPEELILWNPSLAENSTSIGPPATITTSSVTRTITSNPYAYPCTLSESTSYCVAVASPTTTSDGQASAIATPVPRAAGEIAKCTQWFHVESVRDTCESILNTYWLAFEEFYSMNPSVKEDCSGLVLGTYYCVSTYPDGVPPGQPDWTGPTFPLPDETATATSTTTSTSGVSTPSPVQTGIIETCNEFYKVVTGDTCYDIAVENDVVLSDFYDWNPAVKMDCTGLQADVYVCVGVQAPSSITTTSIPTSGVSTPTPIQSGMVTTCSEFYFVASGNSCYDIAVDNGIELASFYDWNPAVQIDCSGLQANVYVCVGVSGGTPTATTSIATMSTTAISTPTPTQAGMVDNCGEFHLVQAGDGCWNLANEQGIALGDFYAWNPAVKDDCSGLQADVYVCVGLA